jgi:hypothetical protein
MTAVTPLLTFDLPTAQVTSPDVTFDMGDFSATTIWFAPVTEAGKAIFAKTFGKGCEGVEIPQSRGEEFIAHIAANGGTAERKW